jgi:hypothetical protein
MPFMVLLPSLHCVRGLWLLNRVAARDKIAGDLINPMLLCAAAPVWSYALLFAWADFFGAVSRAR